MNESLLKKTLTRLADRLQALKLQNLSIEAVLLHQLSGREDEMPLPPIIHPDSFRGLILNGSWGRLTPILPPQRNSSDQELPNIKKGAFANNTIFLGKSRNFQSQVQLNLTEEFLGVAKELGQIVGDMNVELRESHNLWNMWEYPAFGTKYDAGVWIDFVFETAWIPSVEMLNSDRTVYWHGERFKLQNVQFYDESDFMLMMISKIVGKDGIFPKFPNPISTWYSEIEDIVSASQYALDFLETVLFSELEDWQSQVVILASGEITAKWSVSPKQIRDWSKDKNKPFIEGVEGQRKYKLYPEHPELKSLERKSPGQK